jgi:hypothetical protein
VDPDGERTMGVLTKPDLATETVTQRTVIDLVQGKRKDLILGYCVVKNRSADDKISSLDDRNRQESAFFSSDPWDSLAGSERVGIEALKYRLRELLSDITKKELPAVRADVHSRLTLQKEKLDGMGLPRGDQSAQRRYLAEISSRFQTLVNDALGGYYERSPLFTKRPDLKLITRVTNLNEIFSRKFGRYAHTRQFASCKPTFYDPEDGESQEVDEFYDESSGGSDEDSELGYAGSTEVTFNISWGAFGELDNIVLPDAYLCPKPTRGSILAHIENLYQTSRGPELGTVSLATRLFYVDLTWLD